MEIISMLTAVAIAKSMPNTAVNSAATAVTAADRAETAADTVTSATVAEALTYLGLSS